MRHAHLAAALTLGWPLLPQIADAQLSAWLDFDGKIKGEATATGHEDWIEIEGFGVSSRRAFALTGGKREEGTPAVPEITLTKRLDRASTALFKAAVAGSTPYPKVTLDLNFGETTPLARIELENVLLSGQSFEVSSGGSDRPFESISLNFTKITFTYILPDSKELWANYDLAKNVAESSGSGGGGGGGAGGGGGDPDSDGDGMPDSWEATYGLSGSSNDADGDLDGDGLTNLQEFQLGTNPKSGTSFFKAELTPVGSVAGGFDLRWNSVPGKTYVIEWSPDLKTPFATLRTVTATAASTTENITNAGNLGFYRVRPQ
jgi:type VI secretion system secreted protein Hcp